MFIVQSPPALSQAPKIATTVSDYASLKGQEQELKSQLENLTERRHDVANELEGKTGVDKVGIEQRLAIVDNNIARVERDLSDVQAKLVASAPAYIEQPPPRVIRVNNDDDMVAAGFLGSGITLFLLSPIIWRWFRGRKNRPATAPAAAALPNERMDRMEHAIDSIAVEIERVSENQRFMTRLMTETQLAGTLAAVRDSAEAAKMAAGENR
jgi:archaellum component FlaC